MLGNVDIISTSVSEAVEKIPIHEKDYRKCSFACFSLHSHSIQIAYQHIAMIISIHCASEKRVYRFLSGNKLADARGGG